MGLCEYPIRRAHNVGVRSSPLVQVLPRVAHSDKPPGGRAPLLYQSHFQPTHVLSLVREEHGRRSRSRRDTLKALFNQIREVKQSLGPLPLLPTLREHPCMVSPDGLHTSARYLIHHH